MGLEYFAIHLPLIQAIHVGKYASHIRRIWDWNPIQILLQLECVWILTRWVPTRYKWGEITPINDVKNR